MSFSNIQIFGTVLDQQVIQTIDVALENEYGPTSADQPMVHLLSRFLEQITVAYASSFPNGASGYSATLKKTNLDTSKQRLTYTIVIDHLIEIADPAQIVPTVPEV
jgi:hypothetical protein